MWRDADPPAGRALARKVVRNANVLLQKRQRFVYYEYPASYEERVIVPLPADVPASLADIFAVDRPSSIHRL